MKTKNNLKTIFKYELPIARKIIMPIGAEIVHVDKVGSSIFFWVECDPEASKEERQFYVVDTGDVFDSENLTYLKTIIFHDGAVVRHVYEVKANDSHR